MLLESAWAIYNLWRAGSAILYSSIFFTWKNKYVQQAGSVCVLLLQYSILSLFLHFIKENAAVCAKYHSDLNFG